MGLLLCNNIIEGILMMAYTLVSKSSSGYYNLLYVNINLDVYSVILL